MSQVESPNDMLTSERDLIEIVKQVVTNSSDKPAIGIGDDAALVQIGAEWLVLTADTMVEETHFQLGGHATWYDIGWKSIATNQSDIAAMGAKPRHALVTLAARNDMTRGEAANLYQGIQDALTAHGGVLVGGDTVVSDRVSIAVTMTGTGVTQANALRLDAARPGDLIVVSGTLGDSRGGFEAISTGADAHETANERLIAKHLRPVPRCDITSSLLANHVQCATDISDGLLRDLNKICHASGVVAEIDLDSVPISTELACSFPDHALTYAMTGGEDYELLIVGSHASIDAVNAALNRSGSAPLTVIGRVLQTTDHPNATSEQDRIILVGHPEAQRRIASDAAGWDHWSSNIGFRAG